MLDFFGEPMVGFPMMQGSMAGPEMSQCTPPPRIRLRSLVDDCLTCLVSLAQVFHLTPPVRHLWLRYI